MPASLTLLCGLFSFYFLEKEKVIAGIVFLAYAFYLHSFATFHTSVQ